MEWRLSKAVGRSPYILLNKLFNSFDTTSSFWAGKWRTSKKIEEPVVLNIMLDSLGDTTFGSSNVAVFLGEDEIMWISIILENDWKVEIFPNGLREVVESIKDLY